MAGLFVLLMLKVKKYHKDIETEVKLEKLKLDEVTTEVGRGEASEVSVGP